MSPRIKVGKYNGFGMSFMQILSPGYFKLFVQPIS